MDWLTLRADVRDAMVEMLGPLEAEEDLRMIMVVAAGTATLKDSARRQYVSDLNRRAGVQPARKATLADIEALGIQVERG